MRFYRIIITDKNGNVLVPNYNGQPGFTPRPPSENGISHATYTSLNPGLTQYDQGSTNPAAQRVELDIPLTALDGATPGSFVRVHGVGLAEISQSANLNGLAITVDAGMARGLPLANFVQSGRIAGGQIVQAFANWIGVEQTLDIYIGQTGSSPSSSDTTGKPGTTLAPTNNNSPANLVFQWRAGQPLMTPLISMLQTAYPQYNVVGAVHEGLVWAGAAATGAFATLNQFAQYIKQKSLSMIGGYAPDLTLYPGVSMVLEGNTINIADGTTQTTPKQIQFIDLIGQPTWRETLTVQACCAMRGDIHVGNYVTLPDLPGITQAGSGSQFYNPVPGNMYSSQKSGSVFTGTFYVSVVRHVGDSRDPGMTSWVTTLDLLQTSKGAQVVQTLPMLYSSTSRNKYGFTV